MMKCKFVGCIRSRGIVEGFCRTHAGRDLLPAPARSTQEGSGQKKTIEDLYSLINTKFDGLSAIVQQLQTENLQLSNQVFELEENLEKVSSENQDLKCKLNQQFFSHDALNQHGRHVNARFLNIDEPELPEGVKEDCVKPVLEIAKRMKVPLSEDDIERCHRLGKPRTNGTSRPIIVRLSSFRKKRVLMKNKKNLRLSEEELEGLTPEQRSQKLRKNPFIVEDLTPFRNHMFHYIRTWNDTNKKFDVVATDYGQIVVKVKGKNTWHRISSPEDFDDADIPMDEKEFKELL